MKYNFYEFTVEGSGEFPFDMLRYDACYPKTQDDVAAMTYGKPFRRSVRLCHGFTTNNFTPTIERWNSFLWAVKDTEQLK